MLKLKRRIKSFITGVAAYPALVDLAAANVRLDNENTALRRELANAKGARRALANDMGALARGNPVNTANAAAVEIRINALLDELKEARSPSTINDFRLRRLAAMSQLFSPVTQRPGESLRALKLLGERADLTILGILRWLRGRDLSHAMNEFCFKLVLDRFEMVDSDLAGIAASQLAHVKEFG